ncbi:MAG: DJ-1/PfpI family protein [Pseudomonadota bacterium]
MKAYSAKNQTRSITILVYDNVKLLDVTGPLQVFCDARQEDGRKAYDVAIASIDGATVSSDTVMPISTMKADQVRPAETFIVAGGRGAFVARHCNDIQVLVRNAVRSARRICSICLGAFVLAEAGVLDGKTATTHWMESHRLSQDYGRVRVSSDEIFVKDGAVWTSAGVSAGIDMALALVEEDLGRKEALRIARMLVLPLKRQGGQTQFSAALRQQINSSTGRFDNLLAAIHGDLSADYSVPNMAALCGMSERNFARLFKREFGTAPSSFVEQRRVHAARDALLASEVPLKALATHFGFGSEENLRRAFKRHFGVTPSSIVEQFTSSRASA